VAPACLRLAKAQSTGVVRHDPGVEHPTVVGPLTARLLGAASVQGRPLTLSAHTAGAKPARRATSTAGGAAGSWRVLALLLNLAVTQSALTG